MSKHTPGPWVLENRGYKFIVSKPDDGYITRDVCRMDASTMSAFAQEANARLIAAAPDLLAALRELVEQEYPASSWNAEHIDYEISMGNGAASAVKRARAAIAKAEENT